MNFLLVIFFFFSSLSLTKTIPSGASALVTTVAGQTLTNKAFVGGSIGQFSPTPTTSIACDMPAGTDNVYSVGLSGFRLKEIWAANGTIQTSDVREKTNIISSVLGLGFIESLNPVSYQWKVGKNVVSFDEENNIIVTPCPGKRTHFGLIAQEVKAALPEGVDFGGWILTDSDYPDSPQALRYDQFIAPLIKAVQELSAKQKDSEALIQSLLNRIAILEKQ